MADVCFGQSSLVHASLQLCGEVHPSHTAPIQLHDWAGESYVLNERHWFPLFPNRQALVVQDLHFRMRGARFTMTDEHAAEYLPRDERSGILKLEGGALRKVHLNETLGLVQPSDRRVFPMGSRQFEFRPVDAACFLTATVKTREDRILFRLHDWDEPARVLHETSIKNAPLDWDSEAGRLSSTRIGFTSVRGKRTPQQWQSRTIGDEFTPVIRVWDLEKRRMDELKCRNAPTVSNRPGHTKVFAFMWTAWRGSRCFCLAIQCADWKQHSTFTNRLFWLDVDGPLEWKEWPLPGRLRRTPVPLHILKEVNPPPTASLKLLTLTVDGPPSVQLHRLPVVQPESLCTLAHYAAMRTGVFERREVGRVLENICRHLRQQTYERAEIPADLLTAYREMLQKYEEHRAAARLDQHVPACLNVPAWP